VNRSARPACVLAAVAAAATLVGLAPKVKALPGTGLPPARVAVSVSADRPSGRPIDEGLVGTNQAVAQAGPLIRKIGPDWARTDASLEGTYDGQSVYDCTTGAWNPVLLSQHLSADRAEGGTPEVIVDYSPTCLTTSVPPGTSPHNAPPDAGGWKPWDSLVEQMASYAIAQRVRVFEVWNEPDWVFFDGNLPAYLQLYQHTARALELAATRAGVRIEVGGPATVTADPVWIAALAGLAVKDRLPLDFVSWHDYATDPLVGPLTSSPLGELPPPPPGGLPPYWYNPALLVQQYGYETQMVRQILERYPSLHPQLAIDEWNLDAGYDPRMGEPYDAAFAAAVLQTVQEAGLDKMAFFRVTDSLHGNPYNNWGMLAVGPGGRLQPKPVYWTFRFWHELAGEQVAASVSPLGEGGGVAGGIRAVASVNGGRPGAARACEVLVSNFTDYDPSYENGTRDPNVYDRTVALGVTGLAPGVYRVSHLAVDAVDTGGPVGMPQLVRVGRDGRLDVSFVSYGDSVNLVKITRS
jgi:hypothetical protein